MSGAYTIEKHAHDISYATFRVARLVRHKELRVELESVAITLVRNISMRNIDSFVGIVRLGTTIGEIQAVNGEVLVKELYKLRASIMPEGQALSYPAESISLADIFSYDDPVDNRQSEVSKPHKKASSTSYPQRRREAIYEFIRQLPSGCRMRDLLVQFPDVSERTLRSDIQKLVDGNLLERTGSKSGPFSYLQAIEEGSADKEGSAGNKGTKPEESGNGTYALLDEENS